MKHVIYIFLLFGLSAHADDFTRKTITLAAPGVFEGIPVAAGPVDLFEPGDLLAKGVLSADGDVQALHLPAGSAIDMESPDRLASVELPRNAPYYTLAKYPFDQGAVLRFGYTEYEAEMRGPLTYHPNLLPGFPTPDLNPAAFDNDVKADCRKILRKPGVGKPATWNCTFELVLASPLEQKFDTQTVTIPAETIVTFNTFGLSSLKLSHDQAFMGLPVSADPAIAIDTWTTGGPQVIVSLSLSQDATYRGIAISAKERVEFYPPDASGAPGLDSFAPLGTFEVKGAGQHISIAPLEVVHLNQDGSLHYGVLAFAQSVAGILLPEQALLFLGDQDGSGIESVGLQPFTWFNLNGVRYGDAISGIFFVDFDGQGHVVGVR